MTTKQKLFKLADFLEHEVEDSWFDMDWWAAEGFPEKKCGTTACAAGWATVCFPDSGLYLEGAEELGIRYKYENGRVISGMEAAAVFFGINITIAEYMFNPSRYLDSNSSRRAVIKRLREVANSH